jgi:hypothetical protein
MLNDFGRIVGIKVADLAPVYELLLMERIMRADGLDGETILKMSRLSAGDVGKLLAAARIDLAKRLLAYAAKPYKVLVNGVPAGPPTLDSVVNDIIRVRDMLASGKAPQANTDSTFLSGHCNGNQFEGHPQVGDLYAKDARAAGVDPAGKVYYAGLARYAGDPEAWVNSKGEIKAKCEERGWGCQGAVNVVPKNVRKKPTKKRKSLKQRFKEAGLPVGG